MMWAVLSVLFDDIIIIANQQEEYYEKFICKIGKDIIPGFGPLSGIHAALTYSENPHCFIFACDLPFISGEIIQNQCKLISNNYDVIIPKHEFGYEPLHSLWSKSCSKSLEQHLLNNPQNLKIKNYLDKIKTKYYNTDFNKAFTNINCQKDIEKILL